MTGRPRCKCLVLTPKDNYTGSGLTFEKYPIKGEEENVPKNIQMSFVLQHSFTIIFFVALLSVVVSVTDLSPHAAQAPLRTSSLCCFLSFKAMQCFVRRFICR